MTLETQSQLNPAHIMKIALELSVNPPHVEATVILLDDGATIPFIARYRKEATGSLDEIVITGIRDRLNQLRELDARRDSIMKSLDERELLTDELKDQIMQAETLTILEDIYLPYRPKRRTRATIAREKGLEPLAELIFAQDPAVDPVTEAKAFIDPDRSVESADEALSGARDIMAEWINEDQTSRVKIRELYFDKGSFSSQLLIPFN